MMTHEDQSLDQIISLPTTVSKQWCRFMSSQKSIEELRQSGSSEMYRESLEAMFEAWLLSDNLPESAFARDAIYCNYKMLMKFLEQSL